MINHKFSEEVNKAFALELKSKVNEYFATNQISRNANELMVIKTIMALLLYLVPYFIMVLLAPNSTLLLFGLWAIMGFAKAFIGTSVMHDSLHGSYSKNRRVNSFIGISAWLVGVDSTIWKLQHNVLHHSYTNIEDADDDIAPRYVLRFSPNQPLRWFHKFQHIYALFFYFTNTLMWVTFKDFAKAYQYHKRGLRKKRSFLVFVSDFDLS